MTYLLRYEMGSGWAFTSLTLDYKSEKKLQKKKTPILSTIFENACHVGKTLGQLSALVLFWLRLGKGNPKLSTMLDPVCQRHISHKALKSHSSLSTQVLYAFFLKITSMFPVARPITRPRQSQPIQQHFILFVSSRKHPGSKETRQRAAHEAPFNQSWEFGPS